MDGVTMRALVAAFGAWARGRGCRELASDTWPENDGSVDAHRRLGFQEVDRVVTFRKALDPDIPVPPSARPPLDRE
jgi:aminoglycoside 6'-N-acetyltransferase I